MEAVDLIDVDEAGAVKHGYQLLIALVWGTSASIETERVEVDTVLQILS
jgi:hypothetical protein